jgi:LemA protein
VRTALLVILVVGVLAVVAWSKYSTVSADLAAQREAIESEWSLVDAALERRAELVPKLRPAESRAGAGAAVWSELASAASALAAAATPRAKIEANNRVSALLAQLPPTESAAALQRLSDAENRIAVERRRYNEMLEHYNAQIQRFPDNIVASLAGFSRDDAYLPTDTGAQH